MLLYVLSAGFFFVGFLLGTTQVSNNYYYEGRTSYTDLYPQGKIATCQGCYLSSYLFTNNNEGFSYSIYLDNLTLNHSYLLMIPDDLILFTYFFEHQLDGLFSITYFAGEVDNVTIRLYEVFTNPFVWRFQEVGDINDLVLLDELVIDLVV